MLNKLKRRSMDPSVNLTLRLTDPDFGMPNVFYIMDEIGRIQVLRRYDKFEDQFRYCGTFEVLHKTERMGRFCIVLKRRRDEWRVPPEYLMESADDMQNLVVAEYYPGVMGRVYMRGLSKDTIDSIVDEYVRRVLRRRKRKRLVYEP